MHSEHANTSLPKLLHLLHTQGGQLTSAAVQPLIQGASSLIIAAPTSSNISSVDVVLSVPTFN
jgi:hypothetical protein